MIVKVVQITSETLVIVKLELELATKGFRQKML